MNIETVRTQFNDLLNDHFSVQLVKTYSVDPNRVRDQEVRSLEIFAIEFVINQITRLHVFGIECGGEFVFTRPKEGIANYLIAELRHYDFYFKLNDQINSRYNLIARIIDTTLVLQAAKLIESTLSFYHNESRNILDYCYGYKVTYNHRYTKTYDAEFEVLITKAGFHHLYRGKILNGEINKILDSENNEVSMDKLFEV